MNSDEHILLRKLREGDTEALDISIMTEKEIEWLNSYHEMVYDRLSPMLDEEEQQWLLRKTTAI